MSDLVAEYLENGDISTALGLASSLSSSLNAQGFSSDEMSEGQKAPEQVEINAFLLICFSLGEFVCRGGGARLIRGEGWSEP